MTLGIAHSNAFVIGLFAEITGSGNPNTQRATATVLDRLQYRPAPGPRWPGKVVDAGFFDEAWK